MNASPRSLGRWIGRSIGFPPTRLASTPPPAWERIAAGPLAGREILIGRRGSGAWEDMIAGGFDAEIYPLLANEMPADGSVVWDVGAHIGFHTLGFAAIVGPTGHVVAFSPTRRIASGSGKTSTETPTSRRVSRFCRARCPIGTATPRLFSAVISSRVASSMSFLEGTTPAIDSDTAAAWNTVVVPVRTTDALIREAAVPAPHLIKIDVEGAELLVLRGAVEIVRSSRPTVIVEAHSARLAFEVTQWLHTEGYDVRVLADLAPSRVLLTAQPQTFTHSSLAPPIPPSA